MRWNGPLDLETIASLPAGRGSYALFLWLPEPAHLAVGRLGEFDFPAGGYVYLGSANGPGGLRARLAHHARLAAHPRWHLDYFRPYAQITGGFVAEGSPAAALPWECAWSQQLLRLPGARPAAPGFGSADCRRGCAAHLIWLPGGGEGLGLLHGLADITSVELMPPLNYQQQDSSSYPLYSLHPFCAIIEVGCEGRPWR